MIDFMMIRKTEIDDALEVLAICKKASSYENALWKDFETMKAQLLIDIRSGFSYVLLDQDKIQCVFSIVPYIESNEQINGNSDSRPLSCYKLQMLATSKRKSGYEKNCLDFALTDFESLRIEIQSSDTYMLELLRKEKFKEYRIIDPKEGTIVFEKTLTFCNRLLQWYKENKRLLPWRENNNPYHVLLSEVMLQQTRVETVKSYYSKFIHVLPTIHSLAIATEDIYLKLWEGLGYYSRVRNLHKAAIYIEQFHEGIIPQDKESLLKIPGIGEYTANALMAIAFNQKTIAVDGNLFRVFSRLTEYSSSFSEKGKQDCYDYFLPLLTENPSEFNQALMDLGELVCLPNGLPKCDICPLKRYCKSDNNNSVLSYPIPKKKTEKKISHLTVFVIVSDDKVMIEKRNGTGLLASLYQFPNVEKDLNKTQVFEYLSVKGFDIDEISPLKSSKHQFTHLTWLMKGYYVLLKKKKTDALFVSRDELKQKYSIPSAFSFYLNWYMKEK